MIEIDVYQGSEHVASAEADTPESAMLAARTLWDEAHTGLQGAHRNRRVVIQAGDDFYLIEGKRP